MYARGNYRSCLSRCALSHYWFSFLKPSWRQNHPLGPWLHFQPFKKVWYCLILLYFCWWKQSCCIRWFCRLIGLLYFSKTSRWTRSTCSDRFYHGEEFEHHICKFDKHLLSFQSIFWNTGFQLLMDSYAFEVPAEIDNDSNTGNEYMKKKQRNDASEVTNPWFMGIFCSKDMFERVEGFTLFLRTREKLPVWWIVCKIQILRQFAVML